MSKISKNAALVLFLVLIGFFICRFFGGDSATESASVIQKSNGTSWEALLMSWLPILIFTFLYILFLRVMKRMLTVMERIAVSIERLTLGSLSQPHQNNTDIAPKS